MLKTFFLLLIALTLFATNQLDLADTYFENEEYEKAKVEYQYCAEHYKNAESAYKLGWMYEKGLGVDVDTVAALYWYKKAARLDSLDSQNKAKVIETIYRNLDPVSDSESTDTLIQLTSGSFALRAYYPNYLVASYTKNIPRGDPTLDGYNGSDPLYSHAETKFQISLRADYMTEWFGFTQMWSGAYTQTSYWQLFVESSPFRDTNYKPELFVTVPFYHKLDFMHMKALTLGYKHASNGQPDNVDTNITNRPRSRSWNRFYLRGYFQWENFFTELTAWYRLPEDSATDDNPDIVDFYGHGSLEIGYIYKKFLARGMVRQNFSTHKGSVELELSYPTYVSKDVFFYIQGFSGYGQSLIDYDHYVNQVGIGLSISR